MSLKTSSVIFVNGCVVCKLQNNQIRIKPLKWLQEEKHSLPNKIVTSEDMHDEINILQKLADGKVTFDDVIHKYLY